LHSDESADEASSSMQKKEKKQAHRNDKHGARSSRSRDFDQTDEFANPMADGLPVDSQVTAGAPSTVAPATPKRKKKKSGFMKKTNQQNRRMETEFAPVDFEANPLADKSGVPQQQDSLGMDDMDVENPQNQQQVPAETQAPPTPPSKKKKRKKKTKKDLNFAEVENPMAIGDEDEDEV
jgi:hypothetical protein